MDLDSVKIKCTCVGDLGRGGPGEMGRSIWFELASGLSGGLSSSGGDGVLASRSGPESLVIWYKYFDCLASVTTDKKINVSCENWPWCSLDCEHFVRVLLTQFGHYFIQLSTHLEFKLFTVSDMYQKLVQHLHVHLYRKCDYHPLKHQLMLRSVWSQNFTLLHIQSSWDSFMVFNIKLTREISRWNLASKVVTLL